MGTLNLGSSGAINSTDLNISGRVAKPLHPYILYRPNATKTIAHNSNTKVDHFGTQEVAQGGLSFSTSTGRITVPVSGLYRVRVKVNSSSEGRFGNDCQMWVRVNGSAYLSTQQVNFAAGGAPSSSNLWYHPVEMDMCVNLNLASDYMEIYLYQNSGSTQTLNGSMGFLECYLIG